MRTQAAAAARVRSTSAAPTSDNAAAKENWVERMMATKRPVAARM
jgi:hypothetical protein